MTVNFTPRITKSQRVQLLLNEFHAPATRAAFAYVFPAPNENGIAAPAQETDQVVFKVKNVAAATYLVRVQVDGAESSLERDTVVGGPTFNEFIGPSVTI
jgi:hypothetical protein